MNGREHPAAIFERERNQALLKKEFPFEISHELMSFVYKALESCSLAGIAAEETQYKNLILRERPFNMVDVQLIMNILIGCTPKELGHSLTNHLLMLENYVYPLRNQWKEIETHISRKVQDSVQARTRIIT